MNEHTIRFRVGVVVFATMVIMAILIVINSDVSWSPFREQYQIQILVDEAPGVAINTPVRRRGLLIGRVAKVEDTDEGALITANIDQGKVIKTSERARVQASLIGDARIDFMRGVTEKEAPAVAPGEQIIGIHNPNPMELFANMQGDLERTVASLGRAGDEVATLANSVNTILGNQDAERFNRLITLMESSLGEFGRTMGHLNDIVGDEQAKTQLKKSITEMPLLFSEAKAIREGLQLVIESADQNFKNLQGLTGPMGDRGGDIIRSLENSALNLQSLLGEFALLSKNLNSSEGTFGMLIRDRQLYDQVTMAVHDVRLLISKVEFMSRKLRPILDDVGTFTDKIARDPGRIIRDAAKRPTLIK
jgi:phospholipid/cholesterol/gamma-HCH transport system substrate-binding protein